MLRTLRTLGVIPARLASTRLPRKVLREIAGKPMLAWVYAAARACPQLDEVLVATDSEEVAALCRDSGWRMQLTSQSLQSGSDRVHAVSQIVPAEIYVNIQGDEPLLRPEHLSALLRPFVSQEVQVTTLKVLCTPENLLNSNAVKVVTDVRGRALYFSRARVPFDQDHADVQVWKHIGLYAYRAEALKLFHALPPSSLEQAERLEQLRFLENGVPVQVEATPYDTVGVDTEQDLGEVERILRARSAPPGL